MNTIFFGSSKYVLPLIEKLSQKFDISLVVTTEKKETDAVPKYCLGHHIPYESVSTVKTDAFLTEIRDFGADFAVLADFGLIVPSELIHLFPKGIINIHPSFLPYYRGTTPIQTALKNGDAETAVSIMLLDEEVDHGPLLSQIPLPISPEDTSESLYTKAFSMGGDTLLDVIPAYIAGNLEPREQDHTKATFTEPLTRESGFFSIDNPPTNLSNLIRAYYPWPGVWTKITLFGKERIVKLLPGNMLQVEGKKPMAAKDFLNGYPDTKEILQKLGFL